MQLSIATITWARSAEEERLIIDSLQQLSTVGLPMFVTDGGSGETFINFLHSLPNCTVTAPAKGVWQQAKTSLSAAAQKGEYILYTEPDKLLFFHQLQPIIQSLKLAGDDGIVLFSRSESAFSTFPSFQQMTETAINNYIGEVVGMQADFTYGPFILQQSILPYLLQIPGEIGWGWRPYAFSIAHQLQFKIRSIYGQFHCPAEQQTSTSPENLYRIKQLQQNLDGLLQATKTLL